MVLMLKMKVFIVEHKLSFLALYFVLFALPGNLTALWVLMSYPFKDYQIFPVYVAPVVLHSRINFDTSASVQKRRPRVLTFFINFEKGYVELMRWFRSERL